MAVEAVTIHSGEQDQVRFFNHRGGVTASSKQKASPLGTTKMYFLSLISHGLGAEAKVTS